MEASIQLFGYLVLTFIGFVAPIVVLTLSIYHEGSSILQQQYVSERENAEENIKEQLKKIASGEEMVESEIKGNLKKLRDIKKNAESKLSYLNPKKQIIKLLLPLGISFILVELAQIYFFQSVKISKYSIPLIYPLLLIAISFFCIALFILWKLADIILKVKNASDDKRIKDEQDNRQAILSLLERVQKNTPSPLTKVYMKIEGEEVKDDKLEFSLTVEEKKDLKIGIINSETRMAKNIEMGLVFPTSFIVEKIKRYSFTVDGSQQVIRYKQDLLQGGTNLILDPLQITPLTKGSHTITVFIKGENVEQVYRKFIIKVA